MLTFGIVTLVIGFVLIVIGMAGQEDGEDHQVLLIPGLIAMAIGMIITVALTGNWN